MKEDEFLNMAVVFVSKITVMKHNENGLFIIYKKLRP